MSTYITQDPAFIFPWWLDRTTFKRWWFLYEELLVFNTLASGNTIASTISKPGLRFSSVRCHSMNINANTSASRFGENCFDEPPVWSEVCTKPTLDHHILSSNTTLPAMVFILMLDALGGFFGLNLSHITPSPEPILIQKPVIEKNLLMLSECILKTYSKCCQMQNRKQLSVANRFTLYTFRISDLHFWQRGKTDF